MLVGSVSEYAGYTLWAHGFENSVPLAWVT